MANERPISGKMLKDWISRGLKMDPVPSYAHQLNRYLTMSDSALYVVTYDRAKDQLFVSRYDKKTKRSA